MPLHNRYFWGVETGDFSLVSTTNGAVAVTSSQQAEGTFSIKVQTSNGAAPQRVDYVSSSGIPQGGTVTWRQRVHITTAPTAGSANITNMGLVTTSLNGGIYLALQVTSSSGAYLNPLSAVDSLFFGTSTKINVDQWYQLSLLVTPSTAADATVAYWVDGVRQSLSTAKQTVATGSTALKLIRSQGSTQTASDSVDTYFDAVSYIGLPSMGDIPSVGIGM